MKIILASANKGKIKEIQALLPQYEVIPYGELLGDFDIVEDGNSFKANAILKVKAIVSRLKKDKNLNEYLIISDDSGISIPSLNNEPGIYSARYAGVGSTNQQNKDKLISCLKEKKIKRTNAYYTACMAIAYKNEIYTTHGWMYGDVIDHEIGEGGFGYDPLFIPDGYNETLGVLDSMTKKNLSHRTKALKLVLKIIQVILK